ncbi:sulfatase [Ulvibacterium sp.]|uniref:sulfatase family protein n=1 Tax=Ulvibacterium sp. TaxID=2665914 RepID=UPI0026184B4B|nr:sulfatase [Ulvibacterium sp.]
MWFKIMCPFTQITRRSTRFGLMMIGLFGPLQIYAQKEHPNIIVIVTDDQRWDALGAMGNNIIQTPHMDQLAKEGTLFRNAFVTTPICAASRASILTGLYERKHKFTFGTEPLQEEFINISYPKLLKQAGYTVGFFGKFGVHFENELEKTIFDGFETSRTDGYFRLRGKGWSKHEHLTDITTNDAIDFIEGLDKGQPFCVSISYNAPHADDTNPRQYVWPKRNDTLYQNAKLPKVSLTEQTYHSALPDILRDSLYLGNIRYKWRFDTPEKAEQMIKGYYKMISTIDQNLGKLRSYLQNKGLAENTVIVFIGDNGYFLGERRLAGKWLLYENSLRVPLIIYDPAGGNDAMNEMALNIDLAPTVLDYAHIVPPSQMQGKSLKPLVRKTGNLKRDVFLCEHLYDIPYIPKIEGVRTTKYKYFRYLDTDIEELYDLQKDELEVNNLVSEKEHAQVLDMLRKKTNELIRDNSR